MPKVVSKPGTPVESRLSPLAARLKSAEWLLGLVSPIPAEWLKTNGKSHSSKQSEGGDVTPCSSYRELVSAWRKALRWTPGLDRALGAMLCSVVTTNLVGEQLWFEVIGPPSSGKTTLMEGISTNKQYVLSKDTIRGFYSGWKSGDGDDSSLLEKAAGKTLAMKEGDAFVKAPNIQQILSEGRGIYDRVGRNDYRNDMAKDYEGYRMTWIICGTSAIREEIDSSELGARFLACIVMDGIDDEFEDEVLWRAVNSEARGMLVESNGDPRGQHPEDLTNAMYLTGGYVQYLRENAKELISTVHIDTDTMRYCGRLGKLIAYMRARPTKKDEHQEREFAARLAKQILRLAVATAAVLNKSSIGDPDVVERVRHIALDTAQGATLTITKLLYDNPIGMEGKTLELKTGLQNDRLRKLLRFLRSIDVVELNETPSKAGSRTMTRRWVITERIRRLYGEVEAG